jgi:hypothetical protein
MPKKRRKYPAAEDLPPEFYNLLNDCMITEFTCPHCGKTTKKPKINLTIFPPNHEQIAALCSSF